jgi:hypothetical protein
LKRNLQSHHAIFSKPIYKAKAATIASYKITELTEEEEEEEEEDREDGNVIKECLVVPGNALFNEFKNKTEIQCN